jgi:hypothetical protein
MEFISVGVVKSGKNIVGFRLLNLISAEQHEIKDVSYNSVYSVLSSGKATIVNLKIVGKEIKGINGKLDRYGEIDVNTHKATKQTLVILREIQGLDGKTVGYLCSDALGNVQRFSKNDTIMYAEKLGIANGKITTSEDGVKRISTIEGTYSTIRSSFGTTEKVKETQDNKKNKVGEVRQLVKQAAAASAISKEKPDATDSDTDAKARLDEANKIILELKKFKEYKGSFPQKLEFSIYRYKKCSEKQLKCLKDNLEDWRKNNKPKIEEQDNTSSEHDKSTKGQINESRDQDKTTKNQTSESDDCKSEITDPVEQDKQLSDTQPSTPQEEEEHDNTEEMINSGKEKIDIPKIEVTASNEDCFEYKLIDGCLYIKGFVSGRELEEVVLPDTVSYNGKIVPIWGISIGAFEGNTTVRVVKTGKYLRDIGNSAFKYCRKLEYIDLSGSGHSMIPAEMCRGCGKLRAVKIGNRVERVHELAFYQCSELHTVEMSDKTEVIARCAFEGCTNLRSINCHAKFINEKAFINCLMLSNFDFNSVVNIGTQAFAGTGFMELEIPGNVKELGRQAFADCALLKKVKICEGVEVIKEFCFGKSKRSCARASSYYEMKGFNNPMHELELIDTPKSVIDVGNDAFRHAKLVEVFTGSACESICISFDIPYKCKDKVNDQNSAHARKMSKIIGASVIKTLKGQLTLEGERFSNPASFNVNSEKLLHAPLADNAISFLKLKTPGELVEPHVKFKGALNYVMDVSEPFTKPLSNLVLRMSPVFFVETAELYGDGYNFIYRITFYIKDDLTNGTFLLFTMGREIVYIAELNLATELIMNEAKLCNVKIPIDNILHAGDKIGSESSIGGEDGKYYDEQDKRSYNVGFMLYNRIVDNGIQIDLTRNNTVIYIPAVGKALHLFDSRKDKKDSYLATRNDFVYYTITKIDDYSSFTEFMRNSCKKGSNDSNKFFTGISQMTESAVNRRKADIAVVGTERQDNLYTVSKEFVALMQAKNKNGSDVTPNDLTYKLFIGLSQSYWMVYKDTEWYYSIASKTLNKTHEYNIEGTKVTEYKSNQVVKFSNPYMNGQKGAYIFVLSRNGSVYNVYASKYTLDEIVKMLFSLTYIRSDFGEENIPELMTDANKLDIVTPELFYHFYDVLYSKNDWELKNYSYTLSGLRVQMSISMYKPTGVFYLVMYRYVAQEEYDRKTREKKVVTYRRKALPILPIGNMDRALMVADTTNKNNKQSRFRDEMMALCIMESSREHNKEYRTLSALNGINPENYYLARQLAIDGEKDTEKYLELIDTRAVYMIGTVNHNRNNGVIEYTDEDFDYTEEDYDYTDEDLGYTDEDLDDDNY